MGLGVLVLPRCCPPCTPHSLRQGLVLWHWETPLPPQPSLHQHGFPDLLHGPTLSTPRLGTTALRVPVMLPGGTWRCGARDCGTGRQPPCCREAASPHGARFSHRHAPKYSQETGGWRAASAATGSGQGSCGAGVHDTGVHGAGPSVVWLQQCLDPLVWEDTATPVPAQCQGQEDTGMEMRCSQGWDGPNPLAN